MQAIMAEYWEKVADLRPGEKLARVLKGQYVLKHSSTLEGWESEADYVRERAKHFQDYKGVKTVRLADGSEVVGHYFDRGSYYGIHGFMLVSFKDKEARHA